MKIITSFLALTLIVGASQAQTTMITPEKPFRVSIGTYNPGKSNVRDLIGSSLPQISLGYDISKTLTKKPLLYGVYLDYAQNHHSGTSNSIAGFGIQGRYLSSSPVNAGHFYAGAGIGSYSVKIGKSNSKIGGKIFGGYELHSGYFADFTYTLINKVSGYDPNGVVFAIGRRF